MFEKNRKYKYEEIKEIFKEARVDVLVNPFGDLKKDANKELDAETRFTVMFAAMPVLKALEKKLFGKEEK